MPQSPEHPDVPLRVFVSYAHKDEQFAHELESHLKILQHQGLIETWRDRRIEPGQDWAREIDQSINQADIILLLVSADYLASDHCYGVEMKRAMERNDAGEASVIPVIVRKVDWHSAPSAKLQALPRNAQPITESPNRDTAYYDVATGIEQVARAIKKTEVSNRESLGGAAAIELVLDRDFESFSAQDQNNLRKAIQELL